jgi:hypothetical protein
LSLILIFMNGSLKMRMIRCGKLQLHVTLNESYENKTKLNSMV